MTLPMEENRDALWMLAGMTSGDSGSMDRALPDAGSWHVPKEAAIVHGRLHWRRLVETGDYTATLDQRPGAPNMLDRFVRLCDDDDEAIRRFALRWGLVRGGEWLREGSEPLSEWRALSEHFDALLDVAGRLHMGEPLSAERWERLSRTPFVDVELVPFPDGETEVRVRHQLDGPLSPFARECAPGEAIGFVVSGWLRRSAVVLGLAWDERPHVELQPRSLLGGLALQLAFAIGRVDRLAMCSSCGRPFTPTRRPAAGRRAYCPTCGVQAARRDAQRDYRRKAKEG